MQTLGDYLKKGREARNISLNDVADYTKISKTYLDGIEHDDYSKIPGKPYIKGYISSYAACIGIDECEALKLYDSIFTKTGSESEIVPEIPEKEKKAALAGLSISKKLVLTLVVLTLIILTTGIYFSFLRNQKIVAVAENIAEPKEIIQTAKSPIVESDIVRNRQNGQAFQSAQPLRIEQNTVNKAVTEKHGVSVLQKPAVPETHRTERTAINDATATAAAVLQPSTVATDLETSTATTVLEPSNIATILEASTVINSSDSVTYQIHGENNVKVIKAIACSEIDNRTPQRIGEAFEWSTEKIFIWSRIICEKPPSSIRHIYYFNGTKVNETVLKIRSFHWRTWSYKTLLDKRYIGPWRVDITTDDGKLLESINFEVI